jgi:uncharacterized protein YrrD
MTTQPAVVKQSDLLNQLVLDRSTMEELGRVEVLWTYPAAHRVFGFICKSGFLGKHKTAFKLPQIHTLGASSILVHSQPEATDSEKVQQLESLLHCEVWSDAGNKIGRITDYLFSLQTGEISHYLFSSSGWGGITGTIYQLPPNYILSVGSKRVLVPESAVQSFAVYREGIHQKLSKAREVLKEDYSQVAQELRWFVRQAQTAAEHAKAQAQAAAEQAKEKAQSQAEQLREKTHTFTEQAKTRSQEFVEQIPDPDSWLDDDFFDEPTPATPEPAPKTHTTPPPPPPQPQAPERTATANVASTPITPPPPVNPTAPPKATAQPADDEWDDDELWEEDEPVVSGTYAANQSVDDEDDDDPWI